MSLFWILISKISPLYFYVQTSLSVLILMLNYQIKHRQHLKFETKHILNEKSGNILTETHNSGYSIVFMGHECTQCTKQLVRNIKIYLYFLSLLREFSILQFLSSVFYIPEKSKTQNNKILATCTRNYKDVLVL